jgi:hypothetical protein
VTDASEIFVAGSEDTLHLFKRQCINNGFSALWFLYILHWVILDKPVSFEESEESSKGDISMSSGAWTVVLRF